MKRSLVILTLNEIEGLKAIFDKIPFSQVDEYFVVDGGSTDGSIEFLEGKGVKVFLQEIPGRGEAFKLAVELAKGDIIVFFSPDGNEDPADIPKLAQIIKDGYDIAVASRFMRESKNEESNKFFPLRAWANRAFTFLANLFFRGEMTDTINGYRAVNRESFKKLKVDASGFMIEYQMSIRAMKLGQKIKEIPTIEGQRIGGKSKAKSFPVGFDALNTLIKEILIGKNF